MDLQMDPEAPDNIFESSMLTDLDAQPQQNYYYDGQLTEGTNLTTNDPNFLSGNCGQLPANSQKVHQWYMQHRFQDSGIQSMENSKAPSIVSVNMVGKQQQTSMDTQNEQFINGPTSTTNPSLPTETQNAKRVLPELIPLLEDSDAEVACRTLEIIKHIAKLDAEQPYYEPVIDDPNLIHALTCEMHRSFENKRIVRLALCALFHISNRPQGMQLILDSCSNQESQRQTPNLRIPMKINDSLGQLISDLVQCVAVPAESCFKYALLILHNILCAKNSASKRVVEFIRDERALGLISEWLVEKNEKLLSIIVDIIQIVCDKNSEQKAFFIALNGPAMLCGILSWARYENLLWRTTRLLKFVSNFDPQKIVDSGAYDVLPLNMDHASQRLVAELLHCTRDLSDMSTNKLDISHLLSRLVQLLGTNDMEVRQLCIQSLANLSANNRRNKEFLCQMDIVNTLKHVLFDTEAMLDEVSSSPPKFAEILEDIQENALTALRNLFSGHAFEQEVQQQILQQNGAEFFLRKLQQMRPTLVRKSLLILSKIAVQDTNIPVFRHSCLQIGPDLETNFAERLVYVLYVSSCKFKQMNTIEKINLNELMHLSMLTLQRLCRDNVLLRQIAYYLKEYMISLTPTFNVFLPIFALCSRDDLLVHTSISLLADLTEVPEICGNLMSTPHALSVLETWRNFKNPTGNSVNIILKCIHCIQPIQPYFNNHPPAATIPIHRNTRENSPCHLQTSDSNSYQPIRNPNDSGYYSIAPADSSSTTEQLLCSMISPPDEYYSHMAERYQSMQISSITDDTPTGSAPSLNNRFPPMYNEQNKFDSFEGEDFYCDSRPTEFYM